ncbi:MAG: hypothetical protein ACI8RD_013621 [Bacillariaceae sp.]|jgi:hypothetical protein
MYQWYKLFRNFDILAAVFTEVLNYMHDDLGLISDDEAAYSTEDDANIDIGDEKQ